MTTDESAPKIEDNRVVALTFVMTDADGEELDRATESAPLLYLHGHGNLMPSLELALAGRTAGERFEVELPPEEAFGPRAPDAERALPRDAFPEDLALEPGLELALDDDGEEVSFWIKRVEGNQVFIDFNHPFAGLTVRFAGEVVRIREATADELEHGHPHGEHGDEEH